jgi:hypothetical protein
MLQFDGSFALAKFRLRKDAQAEIDDGGVHRKERVFEAKLVLRRDRFALVEQLIEEPFVNLTACFA